jgi:hypothetical protein
MVRLPLWQKTRIRASKKRRVGDSDLELRDVDIA